VISPVDILCLAIWAGLMFLESRRGIIPALADFLCLLVGVILIGYGYLPLSEHMRPSGAYLLLMAVLLLLTAGVAIFISRKYHAEVSAVEAAVGAALGLGSSIVLTYALFEWLEIRYGAGTLLIKNSLLHWAMSEMSGLRVLSEFYGKLTGK
jgi:phosphate/sulfate permease